MVTSRNSAHSGLPRVVLNAVALTEGGSGVQTYVRELLTAIGSRATQLPVSVSAIVDRSQERNMPGGVAARVASANGGVSRKFRSALQVRGADLVHGLDVDIPWSNKLARVATVHDLAQLDTPWAFSRGANVKRALTRFACRNADELIAVSAFTAERIHAHFGRDAVIVHEAPGGAFRPPSDDAVVAIRTKYKLPEKCVVYVGNFEPRKDLHALVEACRIADIPLVVAGGAVTSIEFGNGVQRLGYVDAADLPAIYGAATVVAYVSSYEGFALPPVEALACGATVMATRVGALPELFLNGIEFVSVGDVAAQANAITELATDSDRRAERVAAGMVEVARLSWEKAAAETAAVWARAL